MPSDNFCVIEGGHLQRYEQAFLDAGKFFVHSEMTEHLKVLNGQSVAAIVIRNHFCGGRDPLTLTDGFDYS